MTSASASAKKGRNLDPRSFLAMIGEGKKDVVFAQKQTVFTQGDAADSIFYIQEGKVRLTVVSKAGKEATLGILTEGEFFGKAAWLGRLCAWGLPPPRRTANFCASTRKP